MVNKRSQAIQAQGQQLFIKLDEGESKRLAELMRLRREILGVAAEKGSPVGRVVLMRGVDREIEELKVLREERRKASASVLQAAAAGA